MPSFDKHYAKLKLTMLSVVGYFDVNKERNISLGEIFPS